MSSILSRVDPLAKAVLERPLLLKSFQAGTVVGLGVLSGIAACLYSWMIPVVRQARSARTKTEAMGTTVALGFRYLQPSGRICGAILASLALICSRSDNPAISSKWKYYATAMAVVVPTAPYEVITIFPINDRMHELDDQLRKEEKDNFQDGRDQEIDSLLLNWQKWHLGRVLAPLVATGIVAWGTLGL